MIDPISKLLAWLSRVHKEKGEERGRLHAIRRNVKDLFKARRIGRNNLGTEKRRNRLLKAQAEIERPVKFLALQKPSTI
ncbi:hypothetical protein KZZ20_01675 [Methylacidiphilum fumariolicum]|uniref:hypothetical protein n=1 Tax=Candidatus Methylacidiphilum fumarolicum TaxID=591154 RepID=UPI00106C5E61|nr:hypothetical protein [Candidatus Methylacidiphilum fumarolicum]MBW6414239.1 hypothetical protein [Candidatus Methylacidiphilum fumarolicum]